MIEKDTEDEILIQNILNGNRQAEEQFFKKYQKIVKEFIRTKLPPLKNVDDLEDCVQMILIKVFENIKLYNPEKSSVKTWVLVIAKHFMIDTYRKDLNSFTSTFNNCGISISNNGAQNLIFNGESTVWATGSASQTSAINGTLSVSNNASFSASNNVEFENCDVINYISSQISPTDYGLLNMKYVQGYSHCEIGKEFNLTSSTVSNRINYIKTKLKKQNADILEQD
jgi:RNA polymerase sigma factor (sigma-70 family)